MVTVLQFRGVQHIQAQATECAFAAIIKDGLVVTWGDEHCGGDSSAVQYQLRGVQQVTRAAFAAILEDGSVVTWGDVEYGADSSAVQGAVPKSLLLNCRSKVQERHCCDPAR